MKTGISLKLKGKLNWNDTKTDNRLKLILHYYWNVAKSEVLITK